MLSLAPMILAIMLNPENVPSSVNSPAQSYILPSLPQHPQDSPQVFLAGSASLYIIYLVLSCWIILFSEYSGQFSPAWTLLRRGCSYYSKSKEERWGRILRRQVPYYKEFVSAESFAKYLGSVGQVFYEEEATFPSTEGVGESENFVFLIVSTLMSATPVSESQYIPIWALSFPQKLDYQHPF